MAAWAPTPSNTAWSAEGLTGGESCAAGEATACRRAWAGRMLCTVGKLTLACRPAATVCRNQMRNRGGGASHHRKAVETSPAVLPGVQQAPGFALEAAPRRAEERLAPAPLAALRLRRTADRLQPTLPEPLLPWCAVPQREPALKQARRRARGRPPPLQLPVPQLRSAAPRPLALQKAPLPQWTVALPRWWALGVCALYAASRQRRCWQLRPAPLAQLWLGLHLHAIGEPNDARHSELRPCNTRENY